MIKKFRSLKHVETVAKLFIEKDFTVTHMGEKVTVNIHNLGYRFEWDGRSIRRFGVCRYSKKRIGLSTKLVSANLEFNAAKIVDTTLHEIAHAIHFHLYKKGGHDKNWSNIAKEIGADGKQYYDASLVKQPTAKYKLVCPHCGMEVVKNRRPKHNHSCIKCYPASYNENFKMTLIKNY